MELSEQFQQLVNRANVHMGSIDEILGGLRIAREHNDLMKHQIRQVETSIESVAAGEKAEQLVLLEQKSTDRVMTGTTVDARNVQFAQYLDTIRKDPNSQYGSLCTELEALKQREVMISINYRNLQDELNAANGVTQLLASLVSSFKPLLETELWVKQSKNQKDKVT